MHEPGVAPVLLVFFYRYESLQFDSKHSGFLFGIHHNQKSPTRNALKTNLETTFQLLVGTMGCINIAFIAWSTPLMSQHVGTSVTCRQSLTYRPRSTLS